MTIKRAAGLSLSLILLIQLSLGQRRQTQAPENSKHPRLVLLIAVDQFRYDYLERFGYLFAVNGIRRLMGQGATWTNANYDHMPTYTAPGHATMMTGAFPAQTGIVGNDWPDRTTGKHVTSVSDDSVKLLGGNPNEPAASPRRLLSSTVGDELRLATNDRSKVIGISVKDRSAILPAGRHANAAYWLSILSGSMVSSTYYFNQLPGWVTSFNNTRPLDKYFGAKWDRLLPESVYLQRAGADAPPWEDIGRVVGDSNTFPHTITGGAKSPNASFYGALDYSPFTNELLVAFAEEAITNEQLGADDDTDVLTVSFSSNDYVGHRYGPYSQEAMDAALRVDREIGKLLDFVEVKIGLANTIVAFTADHGVAPIPEHAEALGLGGGRVNAADVLATVRLAISKRYNAQNKNPDPTSDYIYTFDDAGTQRAAFINGNVYFNYTALARDGIDNNELQQIVCNAALTVKGIGRCFTRNQLLGGAITDPIEHRAVHGFYAARSGDVVMISEPFKYLQEYSITATHGTPYSYDTHVPLILMGRGVAPGRYNEAASPADIAPTLSVLLSVQPPSSVTGRVLTEALQNVR